MDRKFRLRPYSSKFMAVLRLIDAGLVSGSLWGVMALARMRG